MKKLLIVLAMMVLSIGIVSAQPNTVLDGEAGDLGVEVAGEITDQNGVGLNGIDIKAYCDDDNDPNTLDVHIGDDTTTSGFFFINNENPNLGCAVGDKAYVNFTYQGTPYEFSVTLTDKYTNPRILRLVGEITNSVPEFTTITLGMAIIAGTLGLAVLRKK